MAEAHQALLAVERVVDPLLGAPGRAALVDLLDAYFIVGAEHGLIIDVSRGGVLRESGMSQTLLGVLDGELLGARTETRLIGRMRLGGGSLSLGRDHPVAVALRTLDIAPRALVTLSFVNGEIVLHRPSSIGPARPLPAYPGIDDRDGVWTVRYPGTGLIEESDEASSVLPTTPLPAPTGTWRRRAARSARTPASVTTSP